MATIRTKVIILDYDDADDKGRTLARQVLEDFSSCAQTHKRELIILGRGEWREWTVDTTWADPNIMVHMVWDLAQILLGKNSVICPRFILSTPS